MCIASPRRRVRSCSASNEAISCLIRSSAQPRRGFIAFVSDGRGAVSSPTFAGAYCFGQRTTPVLLVSRMRARHLLGERSSAPRRRCSRATPASSVRPAAASSGPRIRPGRRPAAVCRGELISSFRWNAVPRAVGHPSSFWKPARGRASTGGRPAKRGSCEILADQERCDSDRPTACSACLAPRR